LISDIAAKHVGCFRNVEPVIAAFNAGVAGLDPSASLEAGSGDASR